MKKLNLIVIFTLILALIPLAPAFANTDVGLSQELTGNTSLRLDTDIFLASVPLSYGSSLQYSWITVGGKAQTPISDLYGLGAIDFKANSIEKRINLGAGYPIQWNNTTIRFEAYVNNPKWNNFTNWKPNLSISLQFNFQGLFNNSE